jgi:hypothetical protein
MTNTETKHWKVIVTNPKTNESWQAYKDAVWDNRPQAQAEADGVMKLHTNLKAEVIEVGA